MELVKNILNGILLSVWIEIILIVLNFTNILNLNWWIFLIPIFIVPSFYTVLTIAMILIGIYILITKL